MEHARPKPRKTLDELCREQVVSSLSSIKGIGYVSLLLSAHGLNFLVHRPSKANALHDAGCKSLQNLREPPFFELLSRPQQINAQYLIGLDRPMTHEQASTVRVRIASYLVFHPLNLRLVTGLCDTEYFIQIHCSAKR